MRFQHIIEQVYYKPWFITPEGYASVRTVVESKFAQSIDGTDDNNALTMLIRQRTPACVDANGIGHVNMLGVLGNKLSKIEESCGNTDYQRVASEISGLIDAGVSGIMFDIDSPGGTVAGNAELVDMIQSIPVPTVAFTDSQMCSAAYNVAASCKYIFATKSATIGSIGCIIPWVDKSEMWSDAGLKFDPITNKDADLKSAMHGPSLTSEQREYLQAYVEEAYSQFKGNVLRNRKVPSSAMRGQGFLGTQALKNNLIDGLLTKDAAYSKLLSVVR
jgi:signal peptide peptidase SppA